MENTLIPNYALPYYSVRNVAGAKEKNVTWKCDVFTNTVLFVVPIFSWVYCETFVLIYLIITITRLNIIFLIFLQLGYNLISKFVLFWKFTN